MDIVLNELSKNVFSENKKIVHLIMHNFILTLKSAIQARLNRTLRTEHGFDDLELMNDYRIAQWRNDKNVPKEQRDYLKTIISKSPMILDLDKKNAKLQYGLDEIKFINDNGSKIYGYGIEFTYLFDFITISFLNPENQDSDWKKSALKVEIQEIIDDDGNINSYLDFVRNISKPELMSSHSEWIFRQIEQGLIVSPQSIWLYREQLYPNLIFCSNVEGELRKYIAHLHELKKALSDLDEFALNYRNNLVIDRRRWGIRDTSPETQDRYETEYTFRRPDNLDAQFYLHTVIIDRNPQPHRIYFYPDSTTRNVFVGYLGHLRTFQYPNLRI